MNKKKGFLASERQPSKIGWAIELPNRIIIFLTAIFLVVFLFSYFLINLLIPGKAQAYTQQDCVNVATNCANRCVNSVNVKNLNINNLDSIAESCAQKCINEITAYCKDPNNSQPKVQKPQQKTQPTVLENPPKIAEKGQPFRHDYSKELTALLGPDSSGCPCSFNLDTLGGFPPMGLILGPDGVLKGTPTGKDSKFRACVKDVGGNTACKIINIDVKKEGESELVVPENFRLTELAYNNLLYGKQFQAGQDERAVLKMLDGSLIHMDMGSTITPVSDYEVKSDMGRFMFDYKPASGGGCGPIGQSPTWACRQVSARDATLRVKGTEFAVDTDKYGTNITVMEGALSVSDIKGKKTVEIAEGQYAYIKNGGLPTEPQSFDASQVDFWWKEKTAEQTVRTFIGLAIFIFILVVFIAALVAIIKKIFGQKKPIPAVAPVMAKKIPETPVVAESVSVEKKKTGRSCALAISIFILLVGLIAAAYFIGKAQP